MKLFHTVVRATSVDVSASIFMILVFCLKPFEFVVTSVYDKHPFLSLAFFTRSLFERSTSCVILLLIGFTWIFSVSQILSQYKQFR